MPGFPVSIGCAVLLTPGVTGAPDSGAIITVLPPFILANGMPLATAGGTLCMMVNSLSGAPYPLLVGPAGASGGILVGGRPLLRMGDRIPTPPGILLIIGPPASTAFIDTSPP